MRQQRYWLRVSMILIGFIVPMALAAQASTVEDRKILASDPFAREEFGGSIALSGEIMIIGTAQDHGVSDFETGFAYIFERDRGGPDNWGLVVRLTASDGANGDEFGTSVSVDGDVAVVGANLADTGAGSNSGAAYVFERDQGGQDSWGEVKKLVASDATAGDHFGISVSISGDTIVVGASRDNTPAGTNSGAAYVFERALGGPENWGEVLELVASDSITGALFGQSVAISEDTIVVGASSTPTEGLASGAAYVFERDHGGVGSWGEIAKLTGSNRASDDRMGESVAISGDTLVVGARLHDMGGNAAGIAYVFERDHGGVDSWAEIAALLPADVAGGDDFGNSVSISGDQILVGARFDDDAGAASGSAYRFERDAGGSNNWGEVEKLAASDAAPGDRFGQAVAIDGATAAAGATFNDDASPADSGNDSGSAYVYSLAVSAPSPTLSFPERIPTPQNQTVRVPVTFNANGTNIAAVVFSIDYDETCLSFDPTDSDADGVPDSVEFSVPAPFVPSVTFAASDTLGELDFTIADFSAPLASLSDGALATIAFSPICMPTDTSIVADVAFGQMPAPSFGDTLGRSVAGTVLDGSVEILPGLPGDCNGDGVVDAGDLSACVLEVFDGDGSLWTDVPSGTFLGSPVGCDANQDTVVDAGDFSCKILLIFNGAGSCSASVAQSSIRRSPSGPEFYLGKVPSEEGVGEAVTVPLRFTGQEYEIASSALSIDYDQNCLHFDPTDEDQDGIPDALTFTLPPGLRPSVSFDASDTSGELDIVFLDSNLPFSTMVDSVVATFNFRTLCESENEIIDAFVRFSSETILSFGDTSGHSVSGRGVDGEVVIRSQPFADGFESGGIARWSSN